MKAYMGSENIGPSVLKSTIRRRWVYIEMPLLLYPRGTASGTTE
jgi:hypothetical protein